MGKIVGLQFTPKPVSKGANIPEGTKKAPPKNKTK
jgi:hypothetical protein